MNRSELAAKSVLELRTVAKEYKVKLSAGIKKAEILERLFPIVCPDDAASTELAAEDTNVCEETSDHSPQAAETKESPSAASEADNAPNEPAVPSENNQPADNDGIVIPRSPYQKAYHNPMPPPVRRTNPARGGFGQAGGFGPRSTPSPRPVPARPGSLMQPERPAATRTVSRFGPAPVQDPLPTQTEPARREAVPAAETVEQPAVRVEASPVFNVPVAAPERPAPVAEPHAPDRPSANAAADFRNPDRPPQVQSPLTTTELLTVNEFRETAGYLELNPEGYGFLRCAALTVSAGDTFVSAAQIKRFNLRNGDFITGRLRPARENDQRGFLLTVETVNNAPASDRNDRPAFDTLTAVYPSRRIELGRSDAMSMRLVDLIAPIGFGQRSVLTCRPGSDKRKLLTEMINSVAAVAPDAKVCALFVDETPEGATEWRETLPACQVWSAVCDQSPENQLRICDLALERTLRMAEAGEDVILFVDSFSRLCRTTPASAVQAGRAAAGSVSPTSLFKARKIFGSARALREGGSLTVFGVLNSDPANRADDVLSEEFRGVATHELCLEAGTSWPCFEISKCANLRHTEMISNDRQLNAIRAVHEGLNSHPEGIPYIIEELREAGSTDQWIERHL